MAFGMFPKKIIFSLKINLNLITRDVFNLRNESHANHTRLWDFIRKNFVDAILDFFEGPCTKNRKFSLNEELDGWKFGKCNNFVWLIRKK